MKIKTVAYRELINTGNFENVAIEMTAEVEEGDDLDFVMAKLTGKVKRQLKEHRSEDDG